ncbi:MAG: RluA family pseudouridine synthase [Cyanobacteria bacterium SZAS-4]|nr:RluA family pseudouridine synthase [Cyanobacteria bacterium SZAS-4]
MDDGLIRLIVDDEAEEAGGVRLDLFLSRAVKDLSRSRIQKLIEDEDILVNNQPAKASLKLHGGELVTIELQEPVELDLQPENIPLEIVFQDEHLAVINKPAGLVTHPGAGIDSGTLVNALLFHMRDSLSGISGTVRPGIVHRLDKDTSGLLVIAKNDLAHRSLAEQIKAKTARRNYIALVDGVMKPDLGTIDKPIGRHPTKRKQMAVVSEGRKAISRFKVIERFAKFTLVKVMLETGRTHQIRVHMSSLGHPVAGDLLYNPKSSGNEAARQKLGLKGHALHAAQLSFTHPTTGMLLEFEAPLPEDFQTLLTHLKMS